MYINRLSEIHLQQALAGGKVTLVLGARQAGKTTLVEHVLQGQNARFLNFDVEIDKSRFLAAASLPPSEALRTLGNPEVMVLDEAQRLPETSRIVKGWHDAKISTRIMLLGSSSLDLLDQSAESLTGRNRKVVLPSLLFAEALGSPCDLFFWRSRTQAEVDLVIKGESGLRAFEIKWNPQRAGSAAFQSAYGVSVEPIGPANPFVADLFVED